MSGSLLGSAFKTGDIKKAAIAVKVNYETTVTNPHVDLWFTPESNTDWQIFTANRYCIRFSPSGITSGDGHNGAGSSGPSDPSSIAHMENLAGDTITTFASGDIVVFVVDTTNACFATLTEAFISTGYDNIGNIDITFVSVALYKNYTIAE